MDELIIKYIRNKCTKTEALKVERWILLSEENSQKFYKLKSEYIASSLNSSISEINIEKFKADVNAKTRVYKLIKKTLSRVAIIIVILGLSAIFILVNKPKQVMVPTNVVTLTLSDGTTLALDDQNSNYTLAKKQGNIVKLNSKDQTLVYKSSNNQTTNDRAGINKIKVPYGKNFELVLDDGSIITLNSGASFSYPTSFKNDSIRSVTLIGEGYFNIAKNKKHPFEVQVNNSKIRVLGTQFNVSAYPEDKTFKTALVEGAVDIYRGNNYNKADKTKLQPGHLAIYNKSSNTIVVEKTDISVYTSWMQGRLVFKHMHMENILKRLERVYDVNLSLVNNKHLDSYFTATFNKDQSISEITNTFKNFYGIDILIN